MYSHALGVLTKPDRSPEASHEKWVRFIDGDMEALYHGWFCVKLHDTETRHPQPTLTEAREQEDQWFNKAFAWQGLSQQARSRLGTKKLAQHLEMILSGLISARYANNLLLLLGAYWEQPLRRIPELGQQIRELEEETIRRLESLGKPPSEDSIGEINSLVDRLVDDIESGIEQRGHEAEAGNLLYKIEAEAVKLKKELRETCPEFRAWGKDKEPPTEVPVLDILLEDGDPLANSGSREIIYLDDVIKKRTR